jgi:outer membrane protein OmpA-like peptidoglycan-associated protein
MKNIFNILYVGLVLFAGSVCAQENAPMHELSLAGSGSIGTLGYNTVVGDKRLGGGGSVGLGYTYIFAPQWGVRTGVEATFYNSRTGVAAMDDSYLISTPADLPADSKFMLNYRYIGFNERQKAAYLQIPLMAEYHTAGNHIFYAAAGVKIGIPLKINYKTTMNSLTATEHSDYSGMDYNVFNYTNVASSGSLSTRTAILGALEAGIKWQLTEHWALYTGLYLDYGMNDIRKETGKPLTAPNADGFTTGSLLVSRNAQGNDYSGKVLPMAIGVKVRLAFGSKAKTMVPFVEALYDDEEPTETAKDIAEQQRKADELLALQERQAAARADSLQQIAALRQAEEERKAAEIRIAEETRRAEEIRKAEEQYVAATEVIVRGISGFPVGQTVLTPEIRTELETKAAIMKQYPDMQIIIEGHTCDLGTHEANISFGQQRADAAKAYLVEQGIAPERLQTVSKAETEPLVPNTSKENRNKNRRVEFKILP